jgi:hypothetical protein
MPGRPSRSSNLDRELDRLMKEIQDLRRSLRR